MRKVEELSLLPWLFGDVNFQRRVDFTRTKFMKADFTRTKFERGDFSGSKFQRVDFIDAELQDASFIRAKFQTAFFIGAKFQWAIFIEAKFQTANFGGAEFQYVADFSKAEFQKAIFSGAKFQAAFLSKAKFQKVDFGWAEFEGVAFSGVEFQESAEFNEAVFKMDPKIDESEHDSLSPDSLDSIGWAYRRSFLVGASHFFGKAAEGHWNETEYAKASESFRNAKVEYEKEGKYDEAGEMYVREKDSIREQLWHQIRSERSSFIKRSIKWLSLNVLKVTCNYGEAPLWFIGWAAFIVLFFGLIYSPLFDWWPPESWESWALIEFKEYPYAEGNSFLTALYFSVVTFATLGFGDITPMNNFGKIVVIIEVLSGYVMFGILITLVARKMTRSWGKRKAELAFVMWEKR